MMIQQVVHLKKEVRKQIYASWLDLNHPYQAKWVPCHPKIKNDYYQLLHDFEELHNEANKILVMNNQLKGLNSLMENRVSQLKLEIAGLKTDFEHLEMIYSNSFDCSEKQLATKNLWKLHDFQKSSEISFENLCKVHKRKSKPKSCS